MYAIYETGGPGPVQLDLWDGGEDEFLDLTMADKAVPRVICSEAFVL